MGSEMKLPPEFNSWGEVWEEHQLRGRMLRELKARLAACEGALRQIAVDPPVSESPTIESILNRAQRIARAALKEPSRG